MKEAELLDKLSDCSAEVPDEPIEDSCFSSPNYIEPYQASKMHSNFKKKIVFRSLKIEPEQNNIN